MKHGIVNQNPEWEFLFPDNIAEWDAITGWERERLASMREHLRGGMVLYDVGAEHGWLSAVYGSFTGRGNLVLVEPSPEMWVNIRKTWEANGFKSPLACIPMFAGAIHDQPGIPGYCMDWPIWTHDWATIPETPSMPYRLIGGGHADAIPTTTIDMLADCIAPPQAITIDVEGFELAVLHGAERTLRDHRPLVWVSVHEDLMEKNCGTNLGELTRYMKAAGYTGNYLGTDHEAHWYFHPNGYEAS